LGGKNVQLWYRHKPELCICAVSFLCPASLLFVSYIAASVLAASVCVCVFRTRSSMSRLAWSQLLDDSKDVRICGCLGLRHWWRVDSRWLDGCVTRRGLTSSVSDSLPLILVIRQVIIITVIIIVVIHC